MKMDGEIDTDVFRELQATAGADFVAELVDTFVEEAPGMLQALREAAARGDADAFRRAAHSLKSNGMTFGATALAREARALEQGGLGSAGQVDALAQAYERAATALKGLRDA
jgi:HPt (histidine-containing phosphotransfer) domain-containing protein